MAGQGMDHADFYYPEHEEPQSYSQSEPEWSIQNHGTNSPSFSHPISPSVVSFSAAQGYIVSATVSPTDQYLPAGPPYGGYAAQRPPPSDPLHPGSEYGLTSRTTFYDQNSGASGYSTAPTATQALQSLYYQQTYEHNTPFSAVAWDSRFEPSDRYTIPTHRGYQTAPGAQDLAKRAVVQQQQQQALTNNRSSTMGDFLGHLEDDPNSSHKATRKSKHKDKRPGRANLNEPEQPRRKALPDSRRTKGPAPDSVNKRTSWSRGGNKAKASPVVTSPSGRSKIPLKNEYDDSEGAEGPEGSNGNNATDTSNGTTTTRTRHNLVEQKYRNRLNAHFDQLLEVLPNTMSEIPGQLAAAAAMSSPEFQGEDRHVGMSMSTSGAFLQPVEMERKVSKAEVLDRARLYIQSLENDTRRLMADQEKLKARFEQFSRRNQGKQGKGGDTC
ncbi:hypothetical protein QBC43DRAFT_307105 [Cladorrhinum sp. PSN259]|nr:hypothetical protein QBC43DRAFT_307105 [Cladorrhinum sp. PSN259]